MPDDYGALFDPRPAAMQRVAALAPVTPAQPQARLIPVEGDPFAQPQPQPSGLPEGFVIDLPDAPWATPQAAPQARPSGLPEGFVIDQPDAPWVTQSAGQRTGPRLVPVEGDPFAERPAAKSWLDQQWERVAPAASVALGAVPGGPLAASALNYLRPSGVAEAVGNVPRSAGQFASDIAQPFIHPVETAGNVANLGRGLLAKAGFADPQYAKYADAVGQHFVDRYGGAENIRRALINDPVGVAGDVSMLLTGGGGAAARLPGVAGRLGEVAGAAGRAVDPLSALAPVANVAGRGAAEAVGLMTGTGAQPLELAARAGYQGGEAARAFRENMTGAAPFEDVVNEARGAVRQMRQERGDTYRTAMQKIGADKTILSWNDVDTALRDMDKVATYKGQSLSPKTEGIRSEIRNAVDDWKNLQASEFWTPEGFDALKKKVGDIRDATPYGTPERVVADQAYQAIRKTIIDQAPDYAKAMKGYEQASNLIRDIEQTLSLKPNANVDTSLRKLQSVLRNNVHTNYGRRADLANYLANAGAPHLMERLAGQALSAWMPRGLMRLGVMEAVPAAVGALGHGAAGAGIGALATLPFASPRLMGEAAYGAGRAARSARPLAFAPRIARQVGRLNNPANPYSAFQ